MKTSRDVRHFQTPADQRGAEWWLVERAEAERAVWLAEDMTGVVLTDYLRDVMRDQLVKRRGYLKHVEDVCEGIIVTMRGKSPDVADMCRRHYIKGEAWETVGRVHGITASAVYGRCRCALRKVPAPS